MEITREKRQIIGIGVAIKRDFSSTIDATGLPWWRIG